MIETTRNTLKHNQIICRFFVTVEFKKTHSTLNIDSSETSIFLPEVQIKEEAIEEASEENFESSNEVYDNSVNNYKDETRIQSTGGVFASTFSCNSCDDKFTTKYDLNSHIGKTSFCFISEFLKVIRQ